VNRVDASVSAKVPRGIKSWGQRCADKVPIPAITI
jgi:hypothetical protein